MNSTRDRYEFRKKGHFCPFLTSIHTVIAFESGGNATDLLN